MLLFRGLAKSHLQIPLSGKGPDSTHFEIRAIADDLQQFTSLDFLARAQVTLMHAKG